MKYEDYADYLTSDSWAKTKKDFKEFSDRSNGICFLCYKKENLHLHHWRYPKSWNNDSYKNLIELCHECHETAHSIEHSKMLHNSYMFDSNSDSNLINYLSFLIKATKAMDYAYIERLSNEF